MSEDPRIERLLDQLLESQVTPEQVCANCPELLSVVRTRWRQMRRLGSDLDILFPKRGERQSGESQPPAIPGYEVQSVLGRGGMGIVFYARHLQLNRPVALKMILAGPYAVREELQRFIHEAEAVAALRHPNIVQVYDVGDHDGTAYFTMEFIEGGSLAQKLLGAPMPSHRAASVIATLAQAMQAAHERGIIHRDLKPANVLLTADGTPKLTDFGLARRISDTAALTLTGVPVGTPSYMSPEQAQGQGSAIGPPTDIYSLGTILYELLTGRPPFRAETASETQRQVIANEPAPPSQLNAKIPRDLETICLKCLQKDPAHRYATAADLAADINRYLRGEPIQARPVGAIERAIKWTRRRPAQTISIAASLLLTVVLSATALWFLSTRSARTRAVNTDLKLVDDLERQGKWDDAHTALLRASIELGSHGPGELQRWIDQDNRDLNLVARLDEIRLNHSDIAGDILRFKGGESYKSAFEDAGIEIFGSDDASTAAKIRNSSIRTALKVAIDDWIVSNLDIPQQQRLLRIALASDENPTEWRRQARNPQIYFDKDALTRLLATAPIAGEPVSLLAELGRQLTALKGDAVPFLIKLQQQYPRDFWVNVILGYAEWDAKNNMDALRFYQAAVVLRPTAASAENGLSYLLSLTDHNEEALVHGHNAVRLDPSMGVYHVNLGIALSKTYQNEEALKQFQLGAKLAPTLSVAHTMLGQCLELLGRKDEAMVEYRLALSFDASDSIARSRIVPTTRAIDALELRWVTWKGSLENDPPDYEKWNGYLELCLYLGHEDEYHRARIRVLALFGNTTDAHVAERAGRACLLLPASQEETRKAVALIDRAVNTDKSKVESWAPDYFQVAKALAEYRQGHLQSATKILHDTPTGVLKAMPQLMLAMMQKQLGENDEARKTLDSALKLFDWSPDRATDADAWMFHVIRRQAEQMIKPTTQSSSRP
jgi:eukaryotic-like serine/threonine-protein kinase